MPQFFSPTSITTALNRLKGTDGKWVIASLVLAANGVNGVSFVKLGDRSGTDAYLDKFFDGKLIGLSSGDSGTVTIQPPFADAEVTGSDLISCGKRKLWANISSRNGYRVLLDRGLLLETQKGKSEYKLAQQFSAEIRRLVASSFKFEDFLTWLYAFSGIGDSIHSWADLLSDFSTRYTHSGSIPQEYQSIFFISPGHPWPTDFISQRPSNSDLQELLLPSRAFHPITSDDWSDMVAALSGYLQASYQLLSEDKRAEIAAASITALASAKRLFVLGEPGSGKSTLATHIAKSFADVLDTRLLILTTTIADQTTPDRLIGYCNISGEWVNGVLTTPVAGKSLLHESIGDPNIRNQVNLIILDEANRRDIESLLSKFQMSLDSDFFDPSHRDHQVALDNAGVRYVSPFTYIIMTGNSPKDDSGRVVQSRPFKRRPNFISMPNLFEELLTGSASAVFRDELVKHWELYASANVPFSTARSKSDFTDELKRTNKLDAFRSVLTVMHEYAAGVTFGLIKKTLRTAATEWSLGIPFDTAFDSGLTAATGLLLSTDVVRDDRSLRESLLGIEGSCRSAFPRFYMAIDKLLDSGTQYVGVRPFF